MCSSGLQQKSPPAATCRQPQWAANTLRTASEHSRLVRVSHRKTQSAHSGCWNERKVSGSTSKLGVFWWEFWVGSLLWAADHQRRRGFYKQEHRVGLYGRMGPSCWAAEASFISIKPLLGGAAQRWHGLAHVRPPAADQGLIRWHFREPLTLWRLTVTTWCWLERGTQ